MDEGKEGCEKMRILSFLFKIRLERFEEIRLVEGDVIWIDDLTKDIRLKIGRRTVQSLIAVLNAMFMCKQFRNYDVVYVPSDFWAQVIGFFVARLCKIPFIIRLRGNPFETRKLRPPTEKKVFARMIRVIFDKVDKVVYSRADLMISICQNLTREFRRINKNIVTVWNGIDSRFFEHKPGRGEVSKKIVFGYVGRVSKEKGMDLILEAIKGMPVKLRVFGAVQYDMVFPEEVEYMGEVPHERIEEAYSKFDVLVLPSFTEGLPRVLQEAMLLGKVVICTDTGDNSIIVDEKGGWVCQPNIEELKQAVSEALKMGKMELLKMGVYNRRKAETIFYSWEEYAEKVKQIIWHCVEKRLD